MSAVAFLNVSFRAGSELAPRIADLAEAWGCSPSQVGKRLTMLAAHGLSANDHETVNTAAGKLHLSFESVCTLVAFGIGD